MADKLKPNARQRILDAAKKLFYENGYENTTMDMISRESGTSKGTITYHFTSKDILAYHVFEGFIKDMQSVLMKKMVEKYRVYDPLLSSIIEYRMFFRWAYEDPNLTSAFPVSTWNEESLTRPSGWDLLDSAYNVTAGMTPGEYTMKVIATRVGAYAVRSAFLSGSLDVSYQECEDYFVNFRFSILKIDPEFYNKAFEYSKKIIDELNYEFKPYFVIE